MEDKELIEKFANEESRNYAFNLLVNKYQKRIYWHVRKMVYSHEDADDLTQDIFVKIWKGLPAFREDAQLFTWIYRIATNECLNFLKKQKRKAFFSFQDPDKNLEQTLLASSDSPSGTTIEVKLQKALLKLPEKQRLVFNMKYFDDMKYEDISKILNISIGGLKANYHHAVKKLEDILNND